MTLPFACSHKSSSNLQGLSSDSMMPMLENIANIVIRRNLHICLAAYHPLPSPMPESMTNLLPRDMSDVARVSHTIVEFFWLGGSRRSSSGVCYFGLRS